MSEVNDPHEKAMELADQAFIARRRGENELALELSHSALEFESAAAEALKDDIAAEPTRSILYRSAASLAIDCSEYRTAERLVATALAGDPPEDIAEELRDLLEEVHFSRHLVLSHVQLAPGELQLRIAGKAIGYGITLSEILIERIKDIERLIYRAVERKLGHPFRERGSTRASIQKSYSLYLTAPRAGSFALTLRLGQQMELPGLDLSTQVIDDLLDCFTFFNNNQDDRLKEKIPEEPYLRNFMGLAKRIAPDGDKVRSVELTALHEGKSRPVAITRKQKDIAAAVVRPDAKKQPQDRVTVTGRLLLADATKTRSKIQLIDEYGKAHSIIVPEGMMTDIVRPLWDDVVTVTGVPVRFGLYLEDIDHVGD